jgi:trans-2,3-dihydro-3-hydroxyanthranilate isomerase
LFAADYLWLHVPDRGAPMPRTLDFVLADVFTDRPFGGNPLAVFPRVRELAAETMQAIARELNLSETTFVFPPAEAGVTCTVRIFTPGTELPFAGHPTIGTALVLEAVGALADAPHVRRTGDGATEIVLGEGVGPVPVRLTRGDDGVRAVLTSPRLPARIGSVPPPEVMARLLGLPVEALAGAAMPAAGWSAGVPFLFIPLRDRESLARVRLDGATWDAHLRGSETPHVVALTMADPARGRELDMRMFAPAMGIVEDPATGAAAVAVAGLLAERQRPPAGTTRWLIRQGFDMGRPSLIELEADIAGGTLAAVRVGGTAVLMGRGSLDLP